MRNFVVFTMALLSWFIANPGHASTIDLQDEQKFEYTVKNYGATCYQATTPVLDPVIVVAADDHPDVQLLQSTAPWYQRSCGWIKGACKIWSSLQGENTTTVAPRFDEYISVINDGDSVKIKRLKFAVKFWRFANQGTEVVICLCTSAATAFYVLPDPNKCSDEWSYTDLGSIFTGAATLLGVVKIGVNYIGSYRTEQLQQIPF